MKYQKKWELLLELRVLTKTKNEITHDLQNLQKIWDLIKETAMNSMAPSLIHHESEIIKRTLRDMYDDEHKEYCS